MFPTFLTPDLSNPNFEQNMGCIMAYEASVVLPKKDVDIFTYYVSSIDQLANSENINYNAEFVSSFFETQKMFDSRQILILSISNEIFRDSRKLTTLEEELLNKAFEKSLLSTPTLKGRR